MIGRAPIVFAGVYSGVLILALGVYWLPTALRTALYLMQWGRRNQRNLDRLRSRLDFKEDLEWCAIHEEGATECKEGANYYADEAPQARGDSGHKEAGIARSCSESVQYTPPQDAVSSPVKWIAPIQANSLIQ